MKRDLFVCAAAVVALVAPMARMSAQAANSSSNKIPPIPASSMQTAPQPSTPASHRSTAGRKKKASNPPIVVSQSKPYVAKAVPIQHFLDYINLKAGQEKLPLTLTFTNDGFTSMRCSIAGYPILDRKKIEGISFFAVDMSGNINGGSSQVLIDAIGPAGSTMSWIMTTPRPKLNAIKPTEGGPGDTVVLTGANFCADGKYDVVNFGNAKCSVISAKSDTLEVKVPEDADAGTQKVSVTVIGEKTTEFEFTVNAIPELNSISLNSSPPGQAITITGKNFAKKLADNKVTVGGMEAQVTGGSTTSLTFIIPQALDLDNNPAYGVPVSVQIGKLKSKNDLTIDIQSRVF